MATLTVQSITRAGTVVAFTAAAGGGDRFAVGPTTCLRVKNGGGSPITVTFAATAKVHGDTVSLPAVSVAAGAEKTIGPFPSDEFSAADGTGLVDVTYSGVTTVTVAATSVTQN